MSMRCNFAAPKKPKDDENKNESKRIGYIPRMIHIIQEHQKLSWSNLDMKDV